MAHTDTDISNLKLNRGIKAAIDANLDSIGENEILSAEPSTKYAGHLYAIAPAQA